MSIKKVICSILSKKAREQYGMIHDDRPHKYYPNEADNL